MAIFEWADRKVKAQTVWSIGILKIFCTFVGIVLGAYISNYAIQNVWWFVAIGGVLFLWLVYRFFKI